MLFKTMQALDALAEGEIQAMEVENGEGEKETFVSNQDALNFCYVMICVWVYCLFFVYSPDCIRFDSRGTSWKAGRKTSHETEITGRTPSCYTVALCICCC